MRKTKLRLCVESLQVNTFELSGERGRRGTVYGRQEPQTWYTCWNYETPCCTKDPANAECAASDVYCSAVAGCWVSLPQYGNYGCGSVN
jgi:hypothetical protein